MGAAMICRFRGVRSDAHANGCMVARLFDVRVVMK